VDDDTDGMGHLLFGLPEISQFHLHSRLARKLMTREHRLTVLSGDPVTFEFYCHQGLASLDLRPERRGSTADEVPLVEFAELDCRLAGHPEPSRWQVQRAQARLASRVAPLARLFEHDPPHLLLLCDGRSGMHRMLQFLAVRHGVKVLHIGAGLLPLTLQVDTEGIDGDSSLCRATSQDYRGCQADEEFLAAATGAWLGHAYPPPLARVGVSVPPLLGRLVASMQAVARRQWHAARTGITAWQAAHERGLPPRAAPPDLPPVPYAVVLLQAPTDPRLTLDNPNPVDQRRLVAATRRAVTALDPQARTLVVCAGPPPPRPLALRGVWSDDVVFLPAAAAAVAVATAMLVVTINHPLGLGAILSNTPVLHLGRTPYGLHDVARRTSLDMLEVDAAEVLRVGHSPLRARFLTRVLKDHHIWCPPSTPDSNGIAGLVQQIEARLPGRSRPALRYRAGPVWPLAVDSSRR
jgi:hypothetical protein